MKTLTPRELSIRLALILSFTLSLVGSLWSLYFQLFSIQFCLILFISSLVSSYLVLSWGIKYLVENKFKVIYKTIHNLNLGLRREPKQINMNEDVFGKIREEVIEWDSNNRSEIERLTEQEKFRREFLGNVSHELKTPIFSIQGYILTLLEGGLEDQKNNRNFLLKAEKGINRMIDMVDDLDEISKLESNRIQLNIQKFDLNSLCKEVLESLEYRAKKKKISLEIEKETKPSLVNADPKKISQVFTNLIVNSINHGKEGGRVLIRYFEMGENILVEVKDDGKGIEAEHLPRLFERFYRIDKGRSRADGGSGLGLAIVKHIIEAHEQTINVRSIIGEGSVFSFTLQKTK